MLVDGTIGTDLAKAGSQAGAGRGGGLLGVWTAEPDTTPFFPLLLAAEHTEHIELGTSIAVAFARNPMHLANIGWDLQSFSQGVSCSGSAARSSRTSRSGSRCRGATPRRGCGR
jgi:hypothetical protein